MAATWKQAPALNPVSLNNHEVGLSPLARIRQIVLAK